MFSVLISRPLSNWNLEQTLVSQGIFQYFRGCHDNQLKIYIWFQITHQYQNKRMKLVRNLHVSFFTLDIAWANMRNGWCVFIMSSLMGSYHMSIYHSHRASITVLLQTLPHISDRFSRCFFLICYVWIIKENFQETATRKFFVHFGEKKMWIQRFVWIKFSLFVHHPSFVYKSFWIWYISWIFTERAFVWLKRKPECLQLAFLWVLCWPWVTACNPIQL